MLKRGIVVIFLLPGFEFEKEGWFWLRMCKHPSPGETVNDSTQINLENIFSNLDKYCRFVDDSTQINLSKWTNTFRISKRIHFAIWEITFRNLDQNIRLLKYAIPPLHHKNLNQFSFGCISQTCSAGFLHSFRQYFWQLDFNISRKLLKFYAFCLRESQTSSLK